MIADSSRSRLYGLLVTESYLDDQEGEKNTGSFKGARKTIFERWRKYGKEKQGETKSENERKKKRAFTLELNFSENDSAFCSLCPTDWNPSDLSTCFGSTRIIDDCSYKINFPEISTYSNSLHLISNLFQRGFRRKKKNHECRSFSPEGRYSPIERCSSNQDSGLCNSFDKLLDEVEASSASNTILLCTTPQSILKPDISSSKTKHQKTVSIILPENRTKENMFGVHLQLETVCTWPVPHGQMGSIARQQEHLLSPARYQLEETFPSLSTTICMIFSDNILPLLVSISSDMICDLLIQLRIILFSPLLPTMQFLDIILCHP